MLRSFFIALSTNKGFRTFSERSSLGRRVSRRFVAGMTVDEAIRVCEELNREGIDVSLDSLGESGRAPGVRQHARRHGDAAGPIPGR